jgi:DNA-binding transcriptional regulator GbsR (MarR family)
MTVDDLKKELVEYMEKVHGSRYHRNFFGCLTALLVEDGPTTQERIMELTRYSRASVSLALQKIQLILPVRVLKIMGDRKHYYEYQGGPEQFLVDILNRRTDIPDIDLEMIHTIQKKVEMKMQEHVSYSRLWDYLNKLGLYLKVMHSIRKKSLEKFRMVLQSGAVDELDLPEASALNSGEIADFLNTLMTSETPSKIEYEPMRGKLPLSYVELKREYFRGIKTGLNPLYAQSVANLLIIVHDVIIEGATTQEAIQESTQLPRSTISDVLSLAVDEGIIEVKKSTGSRTKVYRPAVSLIELVLSYYDRAFAYASHVRKKIVDVLDRMHNATPEDSGLTGFLEKLNALERAYRITEEFTIRGKAEFIKELMSEYEGQI